MTDLLNYLHDVFVIKFDGWVILGFIAQGFFTMRFVVQWIASERARKSVIPVAFWFFSIAATRFSLPARRWDCWSTYAISISSSSMEGSRPPAIRCCGPSPHLSAPTPEMRWRATPAHRRGRPG